MGQQRAHLLVGVGVGHQAGTLVRQQQVFVLVEDVQLGPDLREEGVLPAGLLEQRIVCVDLQHVALAQPRVALDVRAVEPEALLPVELLPQTHAHGGHLPDQPLLQLPTVICGGDDEFLHAHRAPLVCLPNQYHIISDGHLCRKVQRQNFVALRMLRKSQKSEQC